jgi:hypothetical protein
MKDIVYKGIILAKNSDAYVLWDIWQKAESDRNQYQTKLDKHLKDLDLKAKELMDRYK